MKDIAGCDPSERVVNLTVTLNLLEVKYLCLLQQQVLNHGVEMCLGYLLPQVFFIECLQIVGVTLHTALKLTQ